MDFQPNKGTQSHVILAKMDGTAFKTLLLLRHTSAVTMGGTYR